jgi:hypothetical protein
MAKDERFLAHEREVAELFEESYQILHKLHEEMTAFALEREFKHQVALETKLGKYKRIIKRLKAGE